MLMRRGRASLSGQLESVMGRKQEAAGREESVESGALSDGDLMARIVAGEQDAMQLVFDRYKDLVFGVAMANLRDRDSAMDVVSNVMVGIWRSAASFRRESSVKSWILAITFNKISDLLKAAHRRYEVTGDAGASEDPCVTWDRDLTPTEREDLQQCLGALPYDQRKAVHLCFYEDLSSTEVADVLGMKAETVRTRLFHARQKLKACLLSKIESRRALNKIESRRNRA